MGEYSVETKNRFQLTLSDSEEEVDVYDILLKHEATKSDKKKNETSITTPEVNNKTKSAKNAKGEKKDRAKKPGLKMDNANVTNIQNTQNKQQQSSAFSPTSNFNKGTENRPPRMRPHNASNKSENFEKSPSSQEQSSGFGGRGKRGGFRGRSGGSKGRRFDRHSGSDRTGVKSLEKRDGFGHHNWGGEIDAQLDTSVQENASADTAEKADGEQTTINEESGGAEVEAAPEPEVKEMTLDEWKASQAGARTKQQFNVRRAGEGEDPKQWKKTVALEPRKRAESTESYEEEEHDVHGKSEATKATLDRLNIQIRFSEGARGGGGGRGGYRGRGRGSGGRPPRRGRGEHGGYNKGNRSEEFVVKVDNEAEFPSLGSK